MERVPSAPPAIMPPGDCRSMDELRGAIDALDARLVALLAQRQRYIERAAEIKADRAAVRDPVRIEAVIAKILAAAQASGLSPAIAEPVWRILIECSIAVELEAFDNKARSAAVGTGSAQDRATNQ